MVALVDPEDWVQLDRKGWKAIKGWNNYYARKFFKSKGRHQSKYLHRVIAKTPPGYECHHKNEFTLDERRDNLENLTKSRHEQLTKFRRIAKCSARTLERVCEKSVHPV